MTATTAKTCNHPLVVWASFFLWVISILAMLWSLILFIYLGDMLLLTETNIINAFLLLSGMLMLPTNIYLLYAISKGQKICYNMRVFCCPLWFCKLCIVLVCITGAALCIERIHSTQHLVHNSFTTALKGYKNVTQSKRFVDNIQWIMKCCGLYSYKDWFTYDWCDKIGDDIEYFGFKRDTHADSVPLSCCKSGSCITNYLAELGTHTINTIGCGESMHRIIRMSLITNLAMFLSIICLELVILRYSGHQGSNTKNNSNADSVPEYQVVQHLMKVNEKFEASSDSCNMDPE